MKKYVIILMIIMCLTACGTKKEKVTKINDAKKTEKGLTTTDVSINYEEPDAEVIIHEKSLNKFLKSVGKIQGNAPFSAGFIKGEYKWTLDNAKIEINPENPRFTAEAKVNFGGIFNYSSVAEGRLAIKYDGDKNKIHLKIEEAVFEIYIKFLGQKVHITDMDAVKFYKSEFEFAGPVPMQSEINMTMPDKSVKKILVKTAERKMYVEQGLIRVTSTMKFEQAE